MVLSDAGFARKKPSAIVIRLLFPQERAREYNSLAKSFRTWFQQEDEARSNVFNLDSVICLVGRRTTGYPCSRAKRQHHPSCWVLALRDNKSATVVKRGFGL